MALPHWRLFLLAVTLLLGGVAAEIAQPYLVKLAIDNYINVKNPDPGGLELLLLAYLGVVVCAFALNYGQAYLLQYIGRTVIFDLRMKVFTHLQSLSLSFFDRNPVGRLVTRVCHDTEAINQLFSQVIVQSLRDIFVIAGVLTVMFQLDTRLAFLSMGVVPVIFFVSHWFRKALREAYRATRAHLSTLNAYLAENLAGMTTVQLFNRQAMQMGRFRKINHDYLEANIRETTLNQTFGQTLALLGQLAVAALMWYGGGAVLQEAVTFGVLYAFITYIKQLFQPVNHLTQQLNVVQSAIAASERLVDLLDESPQVADPPSPRALPRVRGEIRLENVWFAYVDEQWVLRDINLTVRPGETVAFVGATGAGKSSIINVISRFYDVQRGRITIDGIDVRAVRQADLRRQIAVVQQDAVLQAGDIMSNIRLGEASITDEQIVAATRAVGLEETILRLPGGYSEVLHEGGQTLSSGQRQLLSFARALAFDPAVLVLDEATSHVDAETEEVVQAAVKRISQERTTLIIAHRLSTIRHAHQIVVLDHGRIVERGTHDELIALGGYYKRLHDLSWRNEPSQSLDWKEESSPRSAKG